MHRKNILLELSKQAVDIEKRKLFLQEIKDVNMELERLDKKIISYYDDVDKMTTSIKDFSLELNSTIKALFDKTKFQNDKERFGPNRPSSFKF